jgi:hypothetical protein
MPHFHHLIPDSPWNQPQGFTPITGVWAGYWLPKCRVPLKRVFGLEKDNACRFRSELSH